VTELENYDYVIIGAGIIGISLGIELLTQKPTKKILIIDKETRPGVHASGRNSGVLHAGFYYSPDSLKAKFCKQGNLELKKFCNTNNLEVKETGKVVVCQDKNDVTRLMNLYERGIANGVEIELLESKELSRIEPAAQTVDKFIWSPTTAVGNPKEIIKKLAEKFTKMGGLFRFNSRVKLINKSNEVLIEGDGYILSATSIINSAGAYASELAKQVGVGHEYVCLPFLGAYRKSEFVAGNPKRLVYPVPNPINPFLGVHTTNTLFDEIKIGPTAFPVIGKEQYKFLDGFNAKELRDFYLATKTLLKSDSVNILGLAKSEGIKLFKRPLIKKAKRLTNALDLNQKWKNYPAGIRAQIVNLDTKVIEMDYIVRSDKNVVHILNAVSPGWTSSIPFSRWIVENQPLLN
jgi:(S)-2-hydroxyglutarate dehydrogenase